MASNERGHEEDFAEMAIAFRANRGGGVYRRTGTAKPWCDGEPGGSGASVRQMARDFCAEPASGTRADAFDLTEVLNVSVELWRGLDVCCDLLFESSDFFLQGAPNPIEAFRDQRIGDGFGAVAFCLEHDFKIVEAAQEVAQKLLGGAGGLPCREGALCAEIGNELGVNTIGLVAAAVTASVVFNPARIGHMHAMASGMEFRSGEFAVTSCRLHDDQRDGRTQLLAPSPQALDPRLGVFEFGVMKATLKEETGVDFGFGDVETKAGLERMGIRGGCAGLGVH